MVHEVGETLNRLGNEYRNDRPRGKRNHKRARARVAPATQIFARDGDIPLKRTRDP